MKVSMLNPEDVQCLFYWWGQASSVCYDTKTNTPDKIGKHCLRTGHFSGSRSQYILFRVDDCPRFTTDQIARHEQGIMKNVQSFRYVDKSNFSYTVPAEIANNEALVKRFTDHMTDVINLYTDIQDYVKNKVGSSERANEQARYVLPMSTNTSFVVGMDIEALIHFCNMRLCKRTEDVHRELASKIRNAVLEVLPELKDYLVPNCQKYMYCPEGRQSCGAYPTKKQLTAIIETGKDTIKQNETQSKSNAERVELLQM